MGHKKMNIFDMVLFSVCGMVVLDTVGASAAMGVSSFTLWMIGILCFFLPYGLMCAELGSSFPQEGGIYVWVKNAYGDFFAHMTSWFFWINNCFWIPSVFVLFTGILASIFFPQMSNLSQMIFGIVLIWISMVVGIFDLKISKWVPNIGAIFKISILLILGFFGLFFGLKNGFANEFSVQGLKVNWGDTLAYAGIVVFNFMGFDLVSTVGDQLNNPKKDIPRMIILAGLLTAGLYMFATYGLLCAIPQVDINIVTGITDAFQVMFVQMVGTQFLWAFKLLSAAVLFTFVANVITWAIAANNVMGQAGINKTTPAVFSHRYKRYGTPDYCYYIMGIISTVLLVGNYIGVENIAQIFWTLFALSALIFLIPYLLVFPGVIILRKKYPDIERPYLIPGGKWGLYLSVFMGELFMLLTCIMFFIPPEDTTNVLRYELSLIVLILITTAVGVWMYLSGKKRSSFPVENAKHQA
ncbi:MAG: APC family permease [Dehalobacterium sp.]